LPGKPLSTMLSTADDLPGAQEKGFAPQLRLNLQLENLPSADALSVKLNGRVLKSCPVTWESEMPETWQEYAVDLQMINKGDNDLEMTLTADTDDSRPCVCHDVHLRVDYKKM